MSTIGNNVFDREKEILYHEGIERGLEKGFQVGAKAILEWMAKDSLRNLKVFSVDELLEKFLKEKERENAKLQNKNNKRRL